jgi:peptidoglycan-N-acetylglucosamine deacetylase
VRRSLAPPLAVLVASLIAGAATASAQRPLDAAPPPATAPSGPVQAGPPLAGAAARQIPTGCRRGGNPLRFNGPRNRKVVALTFDDGPSAYTADVIRVLARMKAKATFFVLGNQIPGREELLRRELGWGFEIGDHSYDHSIYAGGGARASSQLRRTNARIERATGFAPCLFRPPYGAYNSDLVGRARAQGMMTIVWDVDPRDWSTPGTGVVYSRIVNAARPGSIILMHDGGGPRGQTVAALPRVITTLRARGYRFATVSELLGHEFVYGR